MPQILVVTDPAERAASTVVYRERIVSTDLESDHFSGQLVERVGWAIQDADEIEQEDDRTVPHLTEMPAEPDRLRGGSRS
jgi:hypothetical protein